MRCGAHALIAPDFAQQLDRSGRANCSPTKPRRTPAANLALCFHAAEGDEQIAHGGVIVSRATRSRNTTPIAIALARHRLERPVVSSLAHLGSDPRTAARSPGGRGRRLAPVLYGVQTPLRTQQCQRPGTKRGRRDGCWRSRGAAWIDERAEVFETVSRPETCGSKLHNASSTTVVSCRVSLTRSARNEAPR